MSLLSVNKAINNILTSDQDIVDIVGNSIYPVAIPGVDESGKNVKYPAIVHTRSSFSTIKTKTTGCRKDSVTIQIDIYDPSYEKVVGITEKVRIAVEDNIGEFNDITIKRSDLDSAAEGHTGYAYAQSLIFNITE